MFTLSQLFAIMHFKKDLKVSIFIADKLTTSPMQSTSGISGYSKRA